LIVVDSSALLAIAFSEPEERQFLQALQDADAAFLAPINFLETGVIMIRRGFVAGRGELNSWLDTMTVSLDESTALAGPALAAYLRFGKGFHPARLNLADCFAYALAKSLDAPLLYKGDDFALTDIRSALQPT
jgi:ribonuclease VapC